MRLEWDTGQIGGRWLVPHTARRYSPLPTAAAALPPPLRATTWQPIRYSFTSRRHVSTTATARKIAA